MEAIDFARIQSCAPFNHFKKEQCSIRQLDSLSNKVFLITHENGDSLIYRLYNPIFNLYIDRSFENEVAASVSMPKVYYSDPFIRIEAYISGEPL